MSDNIEKKEFPGLEVDGDTIVAKDGDTIVAKDGDAIVEKDGDTMVAGNLQHIEQEAVALEVAEETAAIEATGATTKDAKIDVSAEVKEKPVQKATKTKIVEKDGDSTVAKKQKLSKEETSSEGEATGSSDSPSVNRPDDHDAKGFVCLKCMSWDIIHNKSLRAKK